MRKIIWLSCLALFFVIAVVSIAVGRWKKEENMGDVQYKIQKYADKHYSWFTGEGSEVKFSLTNFTDFDWDRVLVLDWPYRKYVENIEKEFGINHGFGMDMCAGIVFAKGDQIVHHEGHIIPLYDVPEEWGYRRPKNWFQIYPGSAQNFRVFTRDEAVFKGKKEKRNHYQFRPVN